MYKIYKKGDKRLHDKYIIITQAKNLYEKTTYLKSDILEGSTYKYTWGPWQKYFNSELKKKRLPCHFFSELLNKDYVIYNGISDVHRSYFLEDLVDERIINYKYREGILIALGEDFTKFKIDTRMSIHLADKLLAPLKYKYHLDYDKIVYLDDILLPGWKKKLEASDLRYDIQYAKFLDMNDVYFKMKEFRKE